MYPSLRQLRGLVTAASSFAVFSTVASATVLLSENFDYANNTQLNSTGNWSNNYTSGAGVPFVVNNSALDLTDTVGISSRDFSATAVSSGSLYYGFDFSLSTASSSPFGAFFATLASAPVGSIRTQQGKIFARTSDAGYVLGVSASAVTNTAQFGSTVYDFNTVHRAVVQYNFVDGAQNNTASLFVDGILQASANWDASTEVNLIAFFLTHASGNTPNLTYFDNLVVATTYAEAVNVSAVPEPATYAAIFGALTLSLAVWQRNRRRSSMTAAANA